MAYTKVLATQLFDGYQFLPHTSVLIINNDRVEAIVQKEAAGDDILNIDGIVCPGFINAHCHLELSYLKNRIAQQTGMVDFVLGVMQQRNEQQEIILQAIQEAEQQMIANGIVAVGDVCNTTHTVPQKKNNNLHYTNFIEVSGFVPATAQQRFDEGNTIKQTFINENLNATLVPHSPYSVSEPLLALIYATEKKIASIHYKESQAEVEFINNAKGDFLNLYHTLGINISYYKNLGQQQFDKYLQHTTLAVHNVYTNLEELIARKANSTDFALCLCPNANLYIGNGLPNIPQLITSGIPICLGTDSLASNTQLSILQEIKMIQQHYSTIPIATLLQWATSNGAKALGIAQHYGSFEKGKLGKYVVINL